MNVHKRWSGFLFLLPSLLGVTAFFVLPFLKSLYYTFTQGVIHPKFVGIKNFQELLANTVFRQAAGNTLFFLILAVPLQMIIAIFLSLVLSKRPFRWQRWALLLPMVIPVSSLALAWQGLWGQEGVVSRGLALLGVSESNLLYGPSAFPLLITLYLLKNTGYLTIIISSAMTALPPEYGESFRLDCSSELSFVRSIVVPLISPTLIFSAVVAVMNYFLMFRDIYMLYGDNPPSSVYMLQHFMNRNFYELNYQRLSAAAFLTILGMTVLIIASLALQRRAIRRVG